MKSGIFFVLLVVLLASTSSASSSKKLPSSSSWQSLGQAYTFERYEKEFNKFYENDEERILRKGYFEANLDMVLRHNRDETKSWKLAINHLSDQSPQELRRMLGYRKELSAAHKESAANGGKLITARSASNQLSLNDDSDEAVDSPQLPASVDWREAGIVTAVKDQGGCGSCWSFGTAETVESYWALKTGHLTDLSEQQILDCTPNPNSCGGVGGCGGGIPEIAYQQIMKTGGLSSEWTYPYDSHAGSDYACRYNATRTKPMVQLSTYSVLPSNQYLPVLQHIANVGPLAINVDASAWHFYNNGVFDGCNQTNPDINHVVQLVGYGADPQLGDYWLVRNSWTPVWGEQGYIRLRRTQAVQCGVDLHPQDGTGCNGGPSQVTVCGACGILYDTSFPVIQ